MQQDIAALFNSEFDRNEQLRLAASTLEHLRAAYPEKWAALARGQRVPEFKALVSSVVRVADQSIDHQATVAYVTRAVIDELEAIASSRHPRRVYKRDLTDASKFSHEHATPVEVVLRTVTLPRNRDVPIFEILEALSCRVLVTNSERKQIDGTHAWTVPSSLQWESGIAFGLRTLAPSLVPLVRYHTVDPKLVFSLVPLSPSREELLVRFQKLLGASSVEELKRWYFACRRNARTDFVLSDDIFRGTARVRLDGLIEPSSGLYVSAGLERRDE